MRENNTQQQPASTSFQSTPRDMALIAAQGPVRLCEEAYMARKEDEQDGQPPLQRNRSGTHPETQQEHCAINSIAARARPYGAAGVICGDEKNGFGY
jgi:hypothetical protein